MNLILFSAEEIALPLRRSDVRAQHIINVLRRQPGDTFDVGLLNGPRGKGRVESISSDEVALSFDWGAMPAQLDPITLIIGLPRPQTARKILLEATSLGVSAMHFVTTERGEASYAQSSLWTSGEWRRHLIAGAEQAFCTRLPAVTWGRSFREVIGEAPTAASRIALDNYEASASLGDWSKGEPAEAQVFVALGSERGWTSTERDLLRQTGFTMMSIGQRVLRLETATVSAVSLVKARLRTF